MLRYGFRPSNDERWERIAERAIADAEREDVALREFYEGLCSIMDTIDERLSVGQSELANAAEPGSR